MQRGQQHAQNLGGIDCAFDDTVSHNAIVDLRVAWGPSRRLDVRWEVVEVSLGAITQETGVDDVSPRLEAQGANELCEVSAHLAQRSAPTFCDVHTAPR